MERSKNIQNPKNGIAIASMVCGICSLVFYFFFIGFPLAIIAVILGHVQLSNIRKKPEEYEGQGMAIAGLVCGYIAIVFTVLGILFISSLFSWYTSWYESLLFEALDF